MSKIIAFYGANGSGKTTLAVNVASKLSNDGAVVGLIQTNLSYPSMQSFLAMKVEDTDSNMQNICFEEDNKKRNEEQQFVQHPKNKHLFVLTVTNNCDCLTFADTNAMDDVNNVGSFWEHLKYSDFDYIVVDCDNNVNNILASAALFYADVIVNILKPTIQGLNFYMAYEAFIRKSINKKSDCRVITVANADENMLDLPLIEKNLGTRIDLTIPFDKEVRVAENRGIPAVEKYEYTVFSKNFPKYIDKLTDIIIGTEPIPNKKGRGVNG